MLTVLRYCRSILLEELWKVISPYLFGLGMCLCLLKIYVARELARDRI
jgi:hypothetical protein